MTHVTESPLTGGDDPMFEPQETAMPGDEEGEILEACDHAPEEPAEAEFVDFPGTTLNFSLLFSLGILIHSCLSTHCFVRYDTRHREFARG